MQILLYEESSHQADVVAAALDSEGYGTVTRFQDKGRLLLHSTMVQPDMLILQVKSLRPGLIETIRVLFEAQPLPVVVFSDQAAGSNIDKVAQAGVSAFVVDGLEPRRLASILEIALARFKKFHQVQQELLETRQQLQERKIVDRAKGILMKQQGCSEEDAYQALRRMAMQRSQRIAEVANNVVDMASLLIPGSGTDKIGTVNR
jgi:response regulator NasT